jgi:hypothetical protein
VAARRAFTFIAGFTALGAEAVAADKALALADVAAWAVVSGTAKAEALIRTVENIQADLFGTRLSLHFAVVRQRRKPVSDRPNQALAEDRRRLLLRRPTLLSHPETPLPENEDPAGPPSHPLR